MSQKPTKQRWIYRYENYEKALSQLQKAVKLAGKRELSDLEKQGTIQSFEYTHELACNVMKDYFAHQGDNTIKGSRDASRAAFQNGLIPDGKVWMQMITSRNKTTHTYNEATATAIFDEILENYTPALERFQEEMQRLLPEEL